MPTVRQRPRTRRGVRPSATGFRLADLGVYGFDRHETTILAALVTEDPLLLVGRSGTRTLAVLRKHLEPAPGAPRRPEPASARLPVLSPSDRRAFLRATWSPFLPEAEWAATAPRPNGPLSDAGSRKDNGQTGRKLVMDYYGPRVPLGGGAIFGKHPTHVDRSGARVARELAIDAVKRGAGECLVRAVYAPNVPRPLDVQVELARGDVRLRVEELALPGGLAADGRRPAAAAPPGYLRL
jgi:hypothetical protein